MNRLICHIRGHQTVCVWIVKMAENTRRHLHSCTRCGRDELDETTRIYAARYLPGVPGMSIADQRAYMN